MSNTIIILPNIHATYLVYNITTHTVWSSHMKRPFLVEYERPSNGDAFPMVYGVDTGILPWPRVQIENLEGPQQFTDAK